MQLSLTGCTGMLCGVRVPKRQGLVPSYTTSLISVLRLYYPEIYTRPCKIRGNWTLGTDYPEGTYFKIQRVVAGSNSLSPVRGEPP